MGFLGIKKPKRRKGLSNCEYIDQVQHIIRVAHELCDLDLSILQFLPNDRALEILLERLAEAGKATHLVYRLSQYEKTKAQLYYVRRVVESIRKLRDSIEVVLESLDEKSIYL